MTEGNIHSIESMGLVDGPGIRTVVFLQGCHLRCRYCHNPDTWSCSAKGALSLIPSELVKRLVRFKPYYKNDGGVTFSGGEPLLQKDFLKESLKLCRENGIHTCLDTAGCGNGDYEEILSYTDLILFDVKHWDHEGYRALTGRDDTEALRFFECAQKAKVPLWIRQVVVPGITDSDEYMEGLRSFISSVKYVERVELLPYHTLGVEKYKSLNIPYPLEGTEPMKQEAVLPWQEIFNNDLKIYKSR